MNDSVYLAGATSQSGSYVEGCCELGAEVDGRNRARHETTHGRHPGNGEEACEIFRKVATSPTVKPFQDASF